VPSLNRRSEYERKGLKTCTGCHRELPLDKFFVKSSGAVTSRCYPCASDRNRKRDAESVESYLKTIATAIRYRAKQKGVDCTLDWAQLLDIWREQDGICALSGLPLTHHRQGPESRSHFNASVDRVVMDGPYSKDNVMLVCTKVNMMRGKLHIDEFVMMCRAVADTDRRAWDA
jgi:hypothetical protein